MKRSIYLVSVALTLFAICSCDPKEDDAPQLATIETVTPTAAQQAFQVVLEGAINDKEIITDINRGRCNFGFLYVLDSEVEGSAESMFQSYKSSGREPGVTVAGCNTVTTDGKFSATVKNLKPNTMVWYCSYITLSDGSTEIGSTQSTSTTAFSANAITMAATDIDYFKATLNGKIEISDDAKQYCTSGIIWSTQSNTTVTQGTVVQKTPDSSGTISVDLKDLNAGSSYYFRAFVRYNDAGEYFYGDEMTLSTRSADDMAVDLGLSVKWANCDLGATNYKEDGLRYAWGISQYIPSYSSLRDYPYMDYSTGKYTFIGNDISGTEYDAASQKLGGKWRMPTLEEVQELFENSTYEYETWTDVDTIFYTGGMSIATLTRSATRVKGPSGKTVRFIHGCTPDVTIGDDEWDYYAHWTSTLSEENDGMAATFNFVSFSRRGKKYFFNTYNRHKVSHIRPVCEY